MRKNRQWALVIGILLVLSIFLTLIVPSCSPPGTTPTGIAPTTPAGATSKPDKVFRLGCLNSLTGRSAGWGIASQWGARLAVDLLNEKGGFVVGGERYKVELVEYDVRSDPKEGIAGMQKLVDEGVKFIVGSTASIAACQAISEPQKVIWIMGGVQEDATRAGINYTFVDLTGGGAGRLWSKNIGPSGSDKLFTGVDKLAVLTDNSQGGVDNHDDILRNLDPAVEVVFDEIMDVNTTDFSSTIAKIKQADPDALFIFGPGNTNFLGAYPQLKQAGYNVQILG